MLPKDFSIDGYTGRPDSLEAVKIGNGGIPVTATSGECRISVDAPLDGFIYTEAGNFADIYPLIQLDKWLNGADIHAVGYALDDTTSEVDKIGTQETY